ncbi:MAG: N-acetyltransferase [Dehalococcoidia bacterium]
MNAVPVIDNLANTSSFGAPALFSGGEELIVAASAPCMSQVDVRGTRGGPDEGVTCSSRFAIGNESPADVGARDALLDRAMGPRWRNKSSEKLRRGRLPRAGLALVARGDAGAILGTVRLWEVTAGEGGDRNGVPALLLGPLAVDPGAKSSGIGSALMRHAIAEAARLGHVAIFLVGDAPYYARFGFSADKTASLAMPGPYERHRFLALELKQGALDGAAGVLRASGRKVTTAKVAKAA